MFFQEFQSHLNKGPDYPPRPMTGYTSIETPGVSQHIIRPTPRYINVVRTVQQHGHEAYTHPQVITPPISTLLLVCLPHHVS